eukprot:362206-Chlamydomonas_euryale.AAC.5
MTGGRFACGLPRHGAVPLRMPQPTERPETAETGEECVSNRHPPHRPSWAPLDSGAGSSRRPSTALPTHMAPLPLGFAPPSLYHVLGVDDDASDEQLRAAYRRLCLRLHPDKSNATGQAEAAVAAARGVDHGGCEGGGTSCAGADPPLAPEASARFHEVQRAYEVGLVVTVSQPRCGSRAMHGQT